MHCWIRDYHISFGFLQCTCACRLWRNTIWTLIRVPREMISTTGILTGFHLGGPYITLHYRTIAYITYMYITYLHVHYLHYLIYTTLHYLTLPYITLHYPTLLLLCILETTVCLRYRGSSTRLWWIMWKIRLGARLVCILLLHLSSCTRSYICTCTCTIVVSLA
jgi:hypothetical protein